MSPEETAVAQAETRACFTCHKADFCKKCHINQTSGWRKKHRETVVANGTEARLSCHNMSFCNSCHLGTSGDRERVGTT